MISTRYLKIQNSPNKGRGLFAKTDIPKDTIIQVCPYIQIPKDETTIINKTILTNYTFYISDEEQIEAICLGLGSLFNHDANNNTIHFVKEENIIFKTIKEVKKDEELCINYNYDLNKWYKNYLIQKEKLLNILPKNIK